MTALRPNSWRGALQIVRFNWPYYFFVVGLILAGFVLPSVSAVASWLILILLVSAVYFSVASILASHWVYDLSPLADWRWISDWLPAPPERWLMIQAGFDSTHGQLIQRFGQPPIQTVDLYDLPGVGGASVRRARRDGLKQATTTSLLNPTPNFCDTILAVFALHEIRHGATRELYFVKLAHALLPGGRLVLVEHMRDWKNFGVFGPGFLHFLPEQVWKQNAASAGFILEKEVSITPFVRIFLWRKP